MGLTQIKYAARLLSLGQLRKLDVWLHELIRRRAEKGARPPEFFYRRPVRPMLLARFAAPPNTTCVPGVFRLLCAPLGRLMLTLTFSTKNRDFPPPSLILR